MLYEADMKVQTKIQKWGNGLALRVGGVMRDIPRFQEGTLVEVEINETGFTVIKCEPRKTLSFPFSESQLLKELTPALAHADLVVSPLPSELGE
jgi:antitoxin MazE